MKAASHPSKAPAVGKVISPVSAFLDFPMIKMLTLSNCTINDPSILYPLPSLLPQ